MVHKVLLIIDLYTTYSKGTGERDCSEILVAGHLGRRYYLDKI